MKCFRFGPFVLLSLVVMAPTAVRAQGIDPVGKQAQDELLPLAVSIAPNSQSAQTAEAVIRSSLPQTVEAKTPPHYQLTSDHRCVLFGNLFGTGRIFALVEMKDSALGFAEFERGQWQLRQIWNLGLTWRPKGWQSTGDDYLPANPAEKPFELQDFDGDGVPEVVAAGDVEKYYQSFYLLQFDRKTGGLRLLVSAMARPAGKEGYLVLSYNSGHQAIWSETDYLRWERGRLAEVASWHEESPYNGTDPSFTDVSRRGPDGTFEDFHFEDPEVVKNQEIFILQTGDHPYAKVIFTEDKPITNEDSGGEEAWLFQHLTGLPLNLYPADPPPTAFHDQSKITIVADKAAKKRLLGR